MKLLYNKYPLGINQPQLPTFTCAGSLGWSKFWFSKLPLVTMHRPQFQNFTSLKLCFCLASIFVILSARFFILRPLWRQRSPPPSVSEAWNQYSMLGTVGSILACCVHCHKTVANFAVLYMVYDSNAKLCATKMFEKLVTMSPIKFIIIVL